MGDRGARRPSPLFAYGDVDEGHNKVAVEVPGLLSFLAHDNFSEAVPGINDINEGRAARSTAPGDYRPNIPVAYWGFRWMIGFGMASFALGAAGLWLTRRKFWLAAHGCAPATTRCRASRYQGPRAGPDLTTLVLAARAAHHGASR